MTTPVTHEVHRNPDRPTFDGLSRLSYRPPMSLVAQADAPPDRRNGCKQVLKRLKKRTERRRARRDPESLPMYGKYQGWQW